MSNIIKDYEAAMAARRKAREDDRKAYRESKAMLDRHAALARMFEQDRAYVRRRRVVSLDDVFGGSYPSE